MTTPLLTSFDHALGVVEALMPKRPDYGALLNDPGCYADCMSRRTRRLVDCDCGERDFVLSDPCDDVEGDSE